VQQRCCSIRLPVARSAVAPVNTWRTKDPLRHGIETRRHFRFRPLAKVRLLAHALLSLFAGLPRLDSRPPIAHDDGGFSLGQVVETRNEDSLRISTPAARAGSIASSPPLASS